MVFRKQVLSLLALSLGCTLLLGAVAWASVTGSISGIVSDPSGGAVTGAKVTAIQVQTGVRTETIADSKGFYSFPALPVGTYNLEVEAPGFKKYTRSGLVIDVNSALRADIPLAVGASSEKIIVSSEAVHVETQSTQNGEVISGTRMTTVPLNGRAYTDLLALQPGVVPSAYAGQAPGMNDRSPSGGPAASGGGGLNSGNQSINGQREAANGFMVNGANVEEGKNNGAAVVPNLDSIAEFRIITNNFDAEYGNYSGGQVNVATKSGTNGLHGSAFEFFRNTSLDARNFFNPADTGPKAKFNQNQFGGTLGGPVKRDKVFFFVDYQGTRQTRAQTVNTIVPTAAQQAGDLSGIEDTLTGAVSGQALANRLSAALGNPVTVGEPYFFPGCTSSADCVLPNAQISQAAIQQLSPPAANLIAGHFIPQGNPVTGVLNTSAFPNTLNDDKGAIRTDINTRLFGQVSGYYFIDNYKENDAYPNGGATVPGYNGISSGRAQLVSLGSTKTIGTTMVNEFHLSYTRNVAILFQPQGGLGPTLASLGFVVPNCPALVSPPGCPFNGGVGPIDPALEGVPAIGFNNFTIGVPSDSVSQFANTYQIMDGFSKVYGRHTFKVGGQFHYDQINERNFFGQNGDFTFNGAETGSDFADFLIGAPNTFIQASHQILDSRSKYMGLFGQDSWRVKDNLTLNYGVRWEFSQPWYDIQNKTETIVPGVQSVVFPTAPTGWLVPLDPGITRTLAPTKYKNISPRLGLAYSPGAKGGFLSKLTGGPGRTSIRLGFGMFYTSIEDLSQFLEVGDPPYGVFWVSTAPPFFADPFNSQVTGTPEPLGGNPFPFVLPSTNVGPANPNTTFPWSTVEPISSGFVFFFQNKAPYSEHYELSLQRQFGANTVMSLSYIGNQGHRLITSIDANPGDPALCLLLSDPANVTNGTTCGPFGQNTVYSVAPGVALPSNVFFVPGTTNQITGTRTTLNPAFFGSNPYMKEIANSAFNSFQASVRHNSKRSEFLIGYTYGKCLDNSSGLQDSTNPFDPKLSRSLCAFDVTQNFVASYSVQLGLDQLFHAQHGFGNKLASGWEFSGITSFVTGLPITLSENDDNSLTGITTAPVDTPEAVGASNVFAGGTISSRNPRTGLPYFNACIASAPSGPGTTCPSSSSAFFDFEPLGQFGTANRRFFHGPGINNWDMALLKNTRFKETMNLQLRLEAFNIFNHAQFQNPTGLINSGAPVIVNGVNTGGLFGVVTSAHDARILQLAAKFSF
ncbi:MAG TPA: carboxypeptidase regulatory-like domain-containing protein [Candidatus Acidoferrales bacterium]|nr:carboxypeptidase regulatory-like domain-containing protein [Candidatus Acidoferrales bacterium]